MADQRRSFANEDEEAQYYLGLLRNGTREQKIEARDRLSQIFEGRGMVDEATELLEGNARAGIRDRAIFTRLARLYRQAGRDDDADAAMAEAASFLGSDPRYPMRRSAPTPVQHATEQLAPHVAQPVYTLAPQPQRGGGMRIAAAILGFIGAVFGLFAALLALGIGGLGAAFGAEGGRTVVTLGWSALLFCFLGFLGAGFALAKPRFAGALLLISAIGFMISISWFAIITAPLFLFASFFAFLGRR
jgi:hypothetical protein